MQRRPNPRLLALTLCLVPALLAPDRPAAASAADEPATVTVDGPIAGGQHGAPFAAPQIDLEEHGYVAEEFFLEGLASAYRFAEGSEYSADGLWRTERESEAVPYRTRILVVRPRDSAEFNGTVIVHWQNVTAGYELGTVSEGEYLRGYAWVGVSAQKIGIDGFPGPDAAGLKQWDPVRYGTLEHPGDAYSYDIFTQAARVVGPERATEPIDPMAGLEVKRLVAAGASQSASRLRTYINGVHPLTEVFDGYIPYIDFASVVPFEADKSGERRRGFMPTRIRTDLEVPVFVVNSETETLAYRPARQPDTDRYRFWEVAGTSHVSVTREGAAAAEGLESPNWLSYTPVLNAAVRHMHVWLAQGDAPPIRPLIETTSADEGESVAIARDEHGNALGGVRLPALEVPTAEHSGRGKPVEGGNRFAFLYGHARDFSPEELSKLYETRKAFLERYAKELDEAVSAGVVLPEEAPALRLEAEAWAKRALPVG